MNMTEVGYLAQAIGTILLLGGYTPQIIKLLKTGNPTGISTTFWTMIAMGASAIGVNMYLQGTSPEIVVTQALNAILAWYTLYLVYRSQKTYAVHGVKIFEAEYINNRVKYTIKLVASFMGLIAVMNLVGLDMKMVGNYVQLAGTFFLLTAYLPQISYLHTVKDASGISRWLFIVIGLGLLFVTINMIITGASTFIIITEFVNIALILVQFGLTVRYQNKALIK